MNTNAQKSGRTKCRYISSGNNLAHVADVLPWDVLNAPRPAIVLVYTPGAVSAHAARKTFFDLWET